MYKIRAFIFSVMILFSTQVFASKDVSSSELETIHNAEIEVSTIIADDVSIFCDVVGYWAAGETIKNGGTAEDAESVFIIITNLCKAIGIMAMIE